jgi:hypothetical protein
VTAHRRALATVAVAVGLDLVLGVCFAAAQHIGVWDGLYFATTTATTVGYGDITPHGWLPHVISVLVMVTVIPLFGAAFSLFTSGLSVVHIRKASKAAHDEALKARKIAADLYKHATGTSHPLA